MEGDTRKLGLVSVGLGIGVVTLVPVPGHRGSAGSGALLDFDALSQSLLILNLHNISGLDIVQNVLLFLPLGFLLAASPDSRRPGPLPSSGYRMAKAALAGLVLSAAIEAVQAWIPGRFPSLADIVTNALGAGFGAYLVCLGEKMDFEGAVPP